MPVLIRQLEAVSGAHVEHRPGDVALDRVGRLDAANAGVDLHRATAVVAGDAGHHPPVEILAVTVDFALGREQVVQVVVGGLEDRVDLLATLPASQRLAAVLDAFGKPFRFLPAGAEIAELGGGKHVLGFQALGTGRVLADGPSQPRKSITPA